VRTKTKPEAEMFVAAKPPPPNVFEQVALTAAEESGKYF
jgi:hypothetical protein